MPTLPEDFPWGRFFEELGPYGLTILSLGVLVYFIIKEIREKDPQAYVIEAFKEANRGWEELPKRFDRLIDLLIEMKSGIIETKAEISSLRQLLKRENGH